MPDARIIDSRKVPSVNPQRLGRFDQLITYTLGVGQTYLIVLPAEDTTDGTILAAIRRDLEERGKLIGKTFPV